MNLYEEFCIYDYEKSDAWLKKKGVPATAAAWVRSCEAVMTPTRWKPEKDAGQRVLVTPAYEQGRVVDLVAWLPAAPERWFLRRGENAILGIESLQESIVFRKPVVVHATPFDWIMADQAGCCPLTEDSMERFIGIEKIRARPGVGEKIRARLQLAFPVPELEEIT
jgi:hypothetical protein